MRTLHQKIITMIDELDSIVEQVIAFACVITLAYTPFLLIDLMVDVING